MAVIVFILFVVSSSPSAFHTFHDMAFEGREVREKRVNVLL